MSAAGLLTSWPAPHPAAAVVAKGHGVRKTWGDVTQATRWASVTKLVTALTALVAVEEGTLDLDAPAGPEGSTVRHLLAHTSGLAFDENRVLSPPAKRRIYSNRGFEVLAERLAECSGMTFERYLEEAVLEPLGLSDTRLEGTAAAGLVGPLDDLALVAVELSNPTLVSAETLRSATTVAFPGLAGILPGIGRFDPLDWGLGFELRGEKNPHWTGTRNSPATFGHFGGSGSFLWVDPDAGLACAALSGRDFGDWALREWPRFSDAVLSEFGEITPAGG